MSLPLPAVRRPLRILAAGAAVGLVLAGTCLCAAGLWRRAVAGAVASAVDRAGARLGLQVDVSSQRVEGLGTVVLEGVALGRDRRTEPLLTAGLVRVRPGLSLRRGPYPAVVEVEEPTLRLGPDLARLVERVRAPASGGAGAGERAARPLPRIAVRAAQVVVEGRQGPVETWEVPLATVAPGERGALLGAVELRAGPDMPRFLALGGHVGQAGYALELEAAAPVRPAALADWLGRWVAFRSLRFDRSGISLKDVEVGVPLAHGQEVMARLPSLTLARAEDGGVRLDLVRPSVRLERYSNGRHNLEDLEGPLQTMKDGGDSLTGGWDAVALALPVLRVRDGLVTLLGYGAHEGPWSAAARRFDLRLVPRFGFYEGWATWNPKSGGGVLSASGRIAGPADLAVRLDLDAVDLPGIARGLSAEVTEGRADGSLQVITGGPEVRVVGQVRLSDVDLQWDLLSRHPVEGVDLTADVDLVWDRDRDEVRLVSLAATLGRLELSAWGRLRDPAGRGRYQLEVVLGPVPCDDIVNSLPRGMRPHLPDLELAGHATLRGRARGWLSDLRRSVLDVDGHAEGFVVLAGGKDVGALTGPFVHRVRLPVGATQTVSVDPASPHYTPLRQTARALRAAIISSEDTAFWRHSGFDLRQIGASIARNLEAGTIRRGASTLTQQLVKNLYLAPEKTLSRKLEEAYLTWRIEQHVSKARILEIYLNVVEWGPGIYGVGRATRYYFGKRPSQLTLREAAFLAAILPNPVRWGARDARGRPSPRIRRRVTRLLRRMAALGVLSEAAVANAQGVRLRQPLAED